MSSGDRDRLAVVVHEVRSPVAALAAIREAFVTGSDERARRALVRLAVAACEAIERIVTAGPLAALDRRPVRVEPLLRDTAVAAELDGARIRVDTQADLPEIEADPIRLRQALDNLVANALAQTPGAEVALSACAEGGALVLEVRDSGPGIPEREHARVFEPGVRLGTSYPGSGLGLAIVEAIAAAHGGTVRLRSPAGGGTSVALVLPLTSSS